MNHFIGLKFQRIPDLLKVSVEELIKEANELVSIFNAADITVKKNRDKENPLIPKSLNQK